MEENKGQPLDIAPIDVVESFNRFLDTSCRFRVAYGLSETLDNPYEILTGMTDKLGRICRYVKHQERNDPKPDWPDGMAEEMAGLIAYLILLKDYYGLEIYLFRGMTKELMKAVEQHGE